ncbi:MAG: hypothetical protein NC254_00580 [bacterium]|nr:hypothetical protein [bacterium]
MRAVLGKNKIANAGKATKYKKLQNTKNCKIQKMQNTKNCKKIRKNFAEID